MYRVLSLICLVYLILLPSMLNAQYFAVGQDQGNILWREIQTTHFQIIYASDYEVEAQRVAHKLEKVVESSGTTLQHKPGKITVLLHSNSLKSNGFVAWAPARIELFTTPNQESYSQEWLDQLAIHELRHHVQIDKIETELPSIFKLLLGEQAASIVIGAYLPFWFLEGDAVVTETALSKSGRGRLSSFSMELKAQVDQKGIYSFDKAYLGSYKDYIPDYYQFGYQMVANIRNQNGGEVWAKVLHHVAKNPLSINALSKGLKNATGKNQDEHYQLIMRNLQVSNPFKFNSQKNLITKMDSSDATHQKYQSYRYPYFINDTTYVALKSSLNEIPVFTSIDQHQKETNLFTPGNVLDESMSCSNGKIVWMEAKPDLRWEHKDRSFLRIMDIESKALHEQIYEEKILAPTLSPDGQLIAAVKFDKQNTCSIILINYHALKIIKEIKSNNHHAFLTPSWSPEGNALYAIDLGFNGKSLVKIDLSNGSISTLTPPVYGEIKKPIAVGKLLYYTSNQNGKNEGYLIDLEKSITYQVLSSNYGIRDLQSSKDGKQLIYADYTSNGFKIAKKETSALNVKEINNQVWFQDTLSNNLAKQERGIIDLSDQDSSKYDSQKYSKSSHLINPHSWSPLYVDPDNSTLNAGFSIVSQNILSTSITQFGYKYSSVNQAGKWIGKFEYAGWYPILRLYGDYGKEHSSFFKINNHFNANNVLTSQDTVAIDYTQKVMNLHLDAAIPLNLSKGKMRRIVEPEIQIGYSHRWQENSTPSIIFRGSYIPFTYRLYAHNLRQQSLCDIQSRWGQIIDLQFRNTPLGDKQLGNIFSSEGTFFFPGIKPTHGIRFYLGFQEKNSNNQYFNDLVNYPRGYTTVENNRLLTFRGDYVLPLINPDLKITRLYYLKRITLRLHFDASQIYIPILQSSKHIKKNLSSTGGELLTECHLLRFIAPVKIGFRESYLLESKKITSEFILSVNFKGM